MSLYKFSLINTRNALLFTLFLFSGMAALVYEVLWMKELGLLFGNTAYAVATTLSVFFLGLSVGGYTWGRISRNLVNPLKTYAFLEFGIAITACLYFFILDAYRAIYSPLFNTFSESTVLFISVKLLLSIGILFLPAFFMGGTLPVMGQYLIRGPKDLPNTGTILYAINTIGGTFGVLLAGFVLPNTLGFRLSYIFAIGTNVFIGIVAIFLSKTTQAQYNDKLPSNSSSHRTRILPGVDMKLLGFLAFMSGFLSLGLEVLWTRLLSLSFQNTVYMFSSILFVFLIGLAFGSILANLMSRSKINPISLLALILILSGIAVINSPGIFFLGQGTDVRFIQEMSWFRHILTMLKDTSLVILIPTIILGSVLPYLFKVLEGSTEKSGMIIGRLVSVNTAGSILGSLFAGFIFLDYFGLLLSIKIFAILYAIQALWIFFKYNKSKSESYLFIIIFLPFIYIAITSPYNYPLISLLDDRDEVLDTVEGSQATVAVIKTKDNLLMKINNHYGVGNVKSIGRQQRMSELPIIIHNNPKSVFLMGLGTGITSGSTLRFPIEKMTACEIIPEVITLSKKHFSPFVSGLYTDQRARVVVEDARNYLLGTDEKYDLIIGDLFLPWKAGVGGLFTYEHFNVVKSKLIDDGVFFQWIPSYQFSFDEFAIVVRTLLEVFEQVTLWKIDNNPSHPFIAFGCYMKYQSLDIKLMERNILNLAKIANLTPQMIRASILSSYCGNLSGAKELFASGPLNIDDRPIIEFNSPISFRKIMSGSESNLSNKELYNLIEKIFECTPIEADPFLNDLTKEDIVYVKAGLNSLKHRTFGSNKKSPTKSDQL